jgi:UPF0176 protein
VELQKVILFYAFAPVADPNAVRLWQREICERYGLRGRIIISEHGINGTLGGPMSALKRYVRTTKQFPGFERADFKWSSARGDEFPRLSVKVRRELVAFTMPDEIKVDVQGIVGGGKHLQPEEVNALVAERGDEVVFLDGRNAFEAKIGKFKDAIVPDVQTTHDFIQELESGKYDHLKGRPIVTYCTGGVRCEVLSVLMRNRGFEEVYQIAGGVVRYGEKFKNAGLWQGSLYVFDGRMKQDFAANPEVIGKCDVCQAPTSDFYNCSDAACRDLILLCSTCAAESRSLSCSPEHTRGRKPLEIG